MKYIIGPCALESEEIYFNTVEELKKVLKNKDWYYKASFDKANRSDAHADRGIGLNDSIKYFKKVKNLYPDLKITTDVHSIEHVKALKGVIDLVQIPAFLCRQTDLLVEASKNFDIINVKKGQWLNPRMSKKIADKIKSVNSNAEVWITERGTTFGYSKLFVDFGAVEELKEYFDNVILDSTHSTQTFELNSRTGGDSELAKKHFMSSSIYGYDGCFAEVHPNPKNAISDKDSQIKLSEFEYVFKKHSLICELLE